MSIPSAPPPTYDQDQLSELNRSESSADSTTSDPVSSEARLLISTVPNATRFQKGYLGVAGERAAIEGEVQIKGIPISKWQDLYVHFAFHRMDI